MDPMTASVALAGVSAFGKIAGGFSEASSLRAEAKAAELDAKYVNLQRNQKRAQNLENVNDVIAGVNLLRAGRGLNLDSATGRAIRADRRRRGMENEDNDNLSYLQQISALKAKARNARAGARVAPIIGALSAAGDFATMASGFGSLGGAETATASTATSATVPF